MDILEFACYFEMQYFLLNILDLHYFKEHNKEDVKKTHIYNMNHFTRNLKVIIHLCFKQQF